MSEVSLEDFKKSELRIAKVLEVEEVPGADRIWKLTVDAGQGPKQIVAGVKKFYTREALLGRNIVVVNNLAPAVIRGIASNGMLLAAKSGEELTLLTVDKEIAPGSLVG